MNSAASAATGVTDHLAEREMSIFFGFISLPPDTAHTSSPTNTHSADIATRFLGQ